MQLLWIPVIIAAFIVLCLLRSNSAIYVGGEESERLKPQSVPPAVEARGWSKRKFRTVLSVAHISGWLKTSWRPFLASFATSSFFRQRGSKRKKTVIPNTKKLWLWWKRIGIFLFLVGFGGGLWAGALFYQYQGTLPRRPAPASGRVYPLNVHGIVVYQTRAERNRLDEILYSSIAILAASGLMAAIHQKKFGRRATPPKLGPS
jgi:hypothetical protein